MILVTGATGNVGRHVVSGLLERGVPARALARDPSNAHLPDGVEVVVGDLARAGSLATHLDDVDAVFLVWPFLTADGASEIVDMVSEHTPRIVYLSAEAAARRPGSFWAAVEATVEASASEWTFVRPTGFATNTRTWADQIRRSNVVRWVYGQASRSLIDERDIAAVAVRALTEEGHSGSRYVVSGPEALTQVEQVQAIGHALDRSLHWEEIPPDQLKEQLEGIPDSALETWASFIQTPEIVTSTVHDVTGRPAHTFAEWAHAHAHEFR
jgi:uncharacterized protein YbjT (DUF2867 family)